MFGATLIPWTHFAAPSPWVFSVTVAIMCLAPALTAAEENPTESRSADCRYQAPAAPVRDETAPRHVILPQDDVFRPLLAALKEPHFFAGYRFAELDAGLGGDGDHRTFNAASVGFGGAFGVWSVRRGQSCRGLQLGLFGGVFSQFNLDTPSANLLNSDFQVGLQVTTRARWLSARLRVYHQSSHLGDEFLLDHPEFERLDLNIEAVDLLFALDGAWWRLYGGGGFLFRRYPPKADRLTLQAGAEARSHSWSWRSFAPAASWAWVAGLDALSFAERDWAPTISAKAGLEVAGEAGRRLRFLGVFASGYSAFGQFFDKRQETTFGIEGQLAL